MKFWGGLRQGAAQPAPIVDFAEETRLEAVELRRQLSIAHSTIAHLRREQDHHDALARENVGLNNRLRALEDTVAHLRLADSCHADLARENLGLRNQIQALTGTVSHLRHVEEQYAVLASENIEMRKRVDALSAMIAERTQIAKERTEVDATDASREAVALRDRLQIADTTISNLRLLEDSHARLASENASLHEKIEARDASIASLASANENARAGVLAFVEAVQGALFETTEPTKQSQYAATLILGNRPPLDAVKTLINLSDPSHGARPFQYMVPFLAETVRYPLEWPASMEPLRVVDVGSQSLDSEDHIHAPLQKAAPVTTIGFDPFVTPPDGQETSDETMPNGGVIRTYPYLLGDGGDVTFYINRMDTTSSTLPANLELARPFGLLELALECVETRLLPTRRMDDVLTDNIPVDFLKIDVQGAAHNVLAGAPKLLARALVCHIEAEFAPVYVGERLFADVDQLMRAAGFGFLDFYNLGRQRYAAFDTSPRRAFHRGRTLWADCVYIRSLDDLAGLSDDELFRAALIVSQCYNKQDLAAEMLRIRDARMGENLSAAFIAGLDRAKQ